eukprot:2734832-Prymnesium_polylepis.1
MPSSNVAERSSAACWVATAAVSFGGTVSVLATGASMKPRKIQSACTEFTRQPVDSLSAAHHAGVWHPTP